MWRQNRFTGNSDSDGSISDEEDVNDDLRENCVSLTENPKQEVGLQLQSQLEILKGRDEQSCGRKFSNLNQEKQISLFAEDEVEMPDFPDKGGLNFSPKKESTHYSDEEVISDDEDNHALSKHLISSSNKQLHNDNNHRGLESGKEDGAYRWSMVNKEAETLISLNEKALSSYSAYYKVKKSHKGVGGKAKPKFSFHFQPHKDGFAQPFISKDANAMPSKVCDVPKRSETVEQGIFSSIPNLQEDFREENDNHSQFMPDEVEALGKGFVGHSITEILDGLQDNHILQRGNSRKLSSTRERSTELAMKRTVSLFGDRIINDEDQPESMLSGSSSDDGTDYQNLKLPISEMNRQSMADRFQEALASTSSSNEGFLVAASKPSGKLQQVMQSEKERDTEFLKQLKMEANQNDKLPFIVVKIMSRCLDAKLTVCHCSFVKNVEGSQWLECSQGLVDRGRIKIVIFNPRVCGDVDLEVGNLICIHAPWKEVQVMGKDDIILLSAYFSQIQM